MPISTEAQVNFLRDLMARFPNITSRDAALALQNDLPEVAELINRFSAGTLDEAGLRTALNALVPEGGEGPATPTTTLSPPPPGFAQEEWQTWIQEMSRRGVDKVPAKYLNWLQWVINGGEGEPPTGDIPWEKTGQTPWDWMADIRAQFTPNFNVPPDVSIPPGGEPGTPPTTPPPADGGDGDDSTVTVANFEDALIRLASDDLALRMVQGRYNIGGDLLDRLVDIQQNPYNVVTGLQAYGAAGGEPISSEAFLQPSPYGPIVDQLIQELNRYALTGEYSGGGSGEGGGTTPYGGDQIPPGGVLDPYPVTPQPPVYPGGPTPPIYPPGGTTPTTGTPPKGAITPTSPYGTPLPPGGIPVTGTASGLLPDPTDTGSLRSGGKAHGGGRGVQPPVWPGRMIGPPGRQKPESAGWGMGGRFQRGTLNPYLQWHQAVADVLGVPVESLTKARWGGTSPGFPTPQDPNAWSGDPQYLANRLSQAGGVPVTPEQAQQLSELRSRYDPSLPEFALRPELRETDEARAWQRILDWREENRPGVVFPEREAGTTPTLPMPPTTTNTSLGLTPQAAQTNQVSLFPQTTTASRPSNNVQPIFSQNDPYRKAPATTQPPGVPGQVPGNAYTANAARLLGGAVANNPFLTRPARTGLSAGNIPPINQIDPAFWKYTTPSVSKSLLGLFESVGRPREDVLFTSGRYRPPSFR